LILIPDIYHAIELFVSRANRKTGQQMLPARGQRGERLASREYPLEFPHPGYKALESPITNDRLGNNHVFFLPYLMGERSPHNDPAARGTFTGMTMDTTRADMTQAVMEGVAFAIRDSVEVAKAQGIRIERSKICGGGAKSRLWKKMFANILNLEIDTIEAEEGPGLGGAMLAAFACGEYGSVEEIAQKLVRVSDTVAPDPEIAARYEAQYQKFVKIYPALKALFPLIG
jgi:xylulokinase